MSVPAVTTKNARIKLLNARKNGTALASITHMAFGTGTTAPTENDTGLEFEVARVSITYGTQPTPTTLLILGTLPQNSTADNLNITEAAVFDSDGDMIARKVFGAKHKDPLDEFQLDWNEEF